MGAGQVVSSGLLLEAAAGLQVDGSGDMGQNTKATGHRLKGSLEINCSAE